MFRLLTTFTANADGLNTCENAYILVIRCLNEGREFVEYREFVA